MEMDTDSYMSQQPTRVVRLRRKGGQIVQDCDVYIGRRLCMGGWNLPQSEWANPFTVKECGGDASVAVAKYRMYILEQPDLLEKVHTLRGKTLGCWCKNRPDDPCHGDVLVELAESENT